MLSAQVQRPVPRQFRLLGSIWFLIAAYFVVAGVIEAFHPGSSLDTVVWPLFGVIALIGAVGLITGRSYARGVIALCAGLGLLGSSVFLVSAFYPQLPLWWLLAVFGAFFAWSFFFVVKLWPDYAVPRAAG